MTLTKYDALSILIIILLIIGIIVRQLKTTTTPVIANHENLGIKNFIEQVKKEVMSAEKERLDSKQAALFELKDFDLEIKFVVNEKLTEKGEIKYEIVTVGGEKSVSTEKVQTIKLHMTAIPAEEGQTPPSNNSGHVKEVK